MVEIVTGGRDRGSGGRWEQFQICSSNESDELAKPVSQVTVLGRLYQVGTPTQLGQSLLILVLRGIK